MVENFKKQINNRDCPPFLIDCFINKSFFSQAMVDTGCLCHSVIDETLVPNNNIKTKQIKPRPLLLANGKKTGDIIKIAFFELDIDGRCENCWAYVAPNLIYPLILGKPWMELNDVIYMAKRRCLRFGSRNKGLWVRASGWHINKAPLSIKRRVAPFNKDLAALSSVSEFADHLRWARYNNRTIIGAVSIEDITKALQPKMEQSRTDVTSSLPKEIREFVDLFLDDEINNQGTLPPHRPGIDTKIPLQKDSQGREKEIPWGPLYGMSRGELIVLRKTLTELLDKNWIRASSSPGGAPVLFIKKPGGGLRFCVDYRALNAITERDRYPLPLIRETLRLASGATWLSKVDVRSAFHRLRILKGDEFKTAFRTRFGAYEWLVTPFGLAGAPAAFQRWINSVLGKLLGVTCAAYLDDVIIFSTGSLEDHYIKVKEILTRLAKAGLKLDPKKCEFASKETKYLGFIIAVGQGIKVDPDKVRAISNWQRPVDVRGVKSFLGFANFYRNFIDNFAQISAPLHELTKSKKHFDWQNIHESAFEKLKTCFSSAPVLALLHEDGTTVLETDASGWATGGCLSQYDANGKLRPLAYHSKKLTPAECNYEIHDKELLAIIRCLNEWRGELIGLQNPFVILTDHKNLEYFMTSRKLGERQVRWAQFLSEFNFRIQFRSGKKSLRPDALSRRAQDMPKDPDDPRLKEREFQLIHDSWLNKTDHKSELALSTLINKCHQSIPNGRELFKEEELQELWNKAIVKDVTFQELYNTLWQDDRAFPSHLSLKVSRSECEIDSRGALCFRNRLWIPDWEPLRTSLIHRTHDSHLSL